MITRTKIIKISLLDKLYLVTQKNSNSFETWLLLKKKRTKEKETPGFSFSEFYQSTCCTSKITKWTSPPPKTSATITVPSLILESTSLQTQFPVKPREPPTELMCRFMGHRGKPALFNPQWGAGPLSWDKKWLFEPLPPRQFMQPDGFISYINDRRDKDR